MSARAIIDTAIVAALLAAGIAHLHGTGAAFDNMDADRVRQYIFLAAAGTFFGWALYTGAGEVIAQPSRHTALAWIALLSPVIFLVAAHQTRNTINDGPATLGLAAGYLASALAVSWRAKRKPPGDHGQA